MACPFASSKVIFKDKELDITRFAPKHPGGDAINEYVNNDITDVFLAMHGPDSRAHKLVKHLPVTRDNLEIPVTPVQKDFRDLAAQLQEETQSSRAQNLVYWLFDLSIVLLIGYLGVHALLWSSWPTPLKYIIGGGCIALVFLLGGWLTHDIAHKTLTQDPRVIKPLTLFYGSFLLGYSYSWWRSKHNRRHHPLTNIIGKDEDIDTMPLIAWDPRVAEPTWFVRHQHILVWPLLLFARLSWRVSSIVYAIKHLHVDELFFIAMHYIFYAKLLMATGLSLEPALMFALIIDMVSGFLIGFVFLQSHNAKSVYTELHKDFWTHQIQTTSNIKNNFFNNRISGFLNLQIEHHLFP